MTETEWKITFSKNGQSQSIVKSSRSKPDLNTAAILIRDNVFGHLAPGLDFMPSSNEALAYRHLNYYGWTITSIEEFPG